MNENHKMIQNITIILLFILFISISYHLGYKLGFNEVKCDEIKLVSQTIETDMGNILHEYDNEVICYCYHDNPCKCFNFTSKKWEK